MAEIKKYLDNVALGTLVDEIKSADAKVLASAKTYAEGLGVNYDAAGSAATEAGKVQAELDKEVTRAKAREDEIAGLVSTAQNEVDALEEVVATKAAQTDLDALVEKVGDVPAGSTVMGIITNIQENAYDDTALRGMISDLEAGKADKTQVATDIAAAVKVEEDARKEAVKGVQDAVNELSGTHATDKKALEDAIALKASQAALDEFIGLAATKVELKAEEDRAKGEEARIAGLVSAETERAEGVEADFETRISAMETFWDVTEDNDGVVNKLKEIQSYIASDESGAAAMAGNIKANADAIAEHVALDHDFAGADAALKEELEDKIDLKADKTTVEGIDGRLTTAEGTLSTTVGDVSTLKEQMTAVQGAVATKAEAKDLTDAVAALEGVDAELLEKIEKLEAKHGDGEGTVESLIEAARQSAIDAAAADATSKANTAESNAKAEATRLNGLMNSRVEALEAIDHDHSNKAELDLIVSGDKAKWDEAATKAHEHANKGVIDGITAAKVELWDTVSNKAEQTALDGLAELVAANTSAINSFTVITSDEVKAMFA